MDVTHDRGRRAGELTPDTALAEAPPRSTVWAQWFGVLAPPIATLLAIGIDYPVVPWACARTDHMLARATLHVVPLILLVVTLLAGWVAWTHRRRPSPVAHGPIPEGRTDFLALMGVGLSALFTFGIIAHWLPNLFMGPCAQPW